MHEGLQFKLIYTLKCFQICKKNLNLARGYDVLYYVNNTS